MKRQLAIIVLLIIGLLAVPGVAGQTSAHNVEGLANIMEVAGISIAHQVGLTGAGVTVAVVDNFNSNSGSGHHGPTVSSILQTVAPGAEVIEIDATNANGDVTVGTLSTGIDQAIAAGVDVISISLGHPTSRDCTGIMSTSVQDAIDQGITVVVSAGNQGPESGTIFEPACVEEAITVGVTFPIVFDSNRNYDIMLMHISGQGPTLDGRNKPDLVTSPTREEGGTTEATPVVAGTVALLLEKEGPMTPQQVMARIKTTATPIPEYGINAVGAGFLNAAEALGAQLAEGQSTLTLTQIRNSNDYELTVDFETSEVVDFLRWDPGSHLYFNGIEVKGYFTLIEDYMDKQSVDRATATEAIDHELERFPGKTFWVEYTFWGDIHENEPEPRPPPEYKIEGIIHNVPPGAYSAVMNAYVGGFYDLLLQSQAIFQVESTSARSSDLSAEEVILEVTGISATHRAGVTGHHWTEIAVIDTFTGSTHGENMVDAIQLVAPDASIFRYDVSADDGNGLIDSSKILIALENVLNDNRDIATLSGGIPGQFCNAPDMVEAFTNAIQQGLIITAAAGNSGPAEGTIIPPACLPYILAVGVAEPIDEVGDEITLDSRSARGPSPLGNTKPDIIAPLLHDDGGTSEANAIMAGSIALYLDLKGAWNTDQYEIMTEFKNAAKPMPGYSVNEVGAGFLDVAKVLDIYEPDGEAMLTLTQTGSTDDYEFTVDIDTPEEFNLFVFSPPSDLYLNGIKVKDYLGLVDALLPLNHRANNVGMSPEEEWARSNVDQNLLMYPDDIFWVEYTYWGDLNANEPMPRPAPEYKIEGIVHNVPTGSYEARMDVFIGENYQLLLESQSVNFDQYSTSTRSGPILVNNELETSFSVVQDTLNSGEYADFQIDVANIWPIDLPLGSYTIEFSTPTSGVYPFSIVDEVYIPWLGPDEQLIIPGQSADPFSKSGPVGETEEVTVEAYAVNLETNQRFFVGEDTFTLNLGSPAPMCSVQGGSICSSVQLCQDTGSERWIEASDTNSCCSTTCIDITPTYPPAASFSVTPTAGDLATTFQFTDASSDSDGSVTSWQWDFGDGSTSTEQNPSHVYSGGNTFSVTLTAMDDDGGVDFATQFVEVREPSVHPIASFTAEPTTGSTGTNFQFTSTSTSSTTPIISYIWTFGDGEYVTGWDKSHVSHTYESPGTYSVELTVLNDDLLADSRTESITVSNQPTAAFIVAPESGELSTTFQFTDTSTHPANAPLTYLWNFGDGTTSTEQNPSHTFAFQSSFEVILTVTGPDSNTDSTVHYVTVNNQPVASFTSTPSSGFVNSVFAFDSSASHDPAGLLSWYDWNFGDGTTSNQPNPSHTYTIPGTYVVTLTVGDNDNGVDIETKTITVNPLTIVEFELRDSVTGELISGMYEYEVEIFEDFDGNEIPDSWDVVTGIFTRWYEESDGRFTSDYYGNPLIELHGQNYVWLQNTDSPPGYELPAVELNSFTISGAYETVLIYLDPINNIPVASFGVSQNSGDTTTTFQFTDTSTDPDGDPLIYLWNFGDGTVSTQQNPTHRYLIAGTHTVMLTVVDDQGETSQEQQLITVYAPETQVNFQLYNQDFPTVLDWEQYQFDIYDAAGTTHQAGPFATNWIGQMEFPVTLEQSTTYTIIASSQQGFSAINQKFTTGTEPTNPPVEVLLSRLRTDVEFTVVDDRGTPISNLNFDLRSEYDYSTTSHVTDSAGTVTALALFQEWDYEFILTDPEFYAVEPSQNAWKYYTPFSTMDAHTFTVSASTFRIIPRVQPFGSYAHELNFILTSTILTDEFGNPISKAYTSNTNGLPFPGIDVTLSYPPGASEDWVFTMSPAQSDSFYDNYEEDSNTNTIKVSSVTGGQTIDTVYIQTPNQPPIASFIISPTSGSTATNFQLTDSSTDTDGTITSWNWNFGDGTISTLSSPSHIYSTPGTYEVTLTTTDDDGDSDSLTQTVTVIQQSNNPPIASFNVSPTSGTILTIFNFTDSSIDTDGTITSWKWHFGDGTTSTQQNLSYNYSIANNFTVNLTVTDNDGNIDFITRLITVWEF